MTEVRTGTLFVVGTPIGNLQDITLRALEVLKASDLIAAEDTRRSQKLLSAHDLHVPLTSYHEHNKQVKTARLVERLHRGETISLVTDGGTPGVSDPGRDLVREARRAGIAVVPIPGPSAVVSALSVSGLQADSFVFLGFLPRRRGRRLRILKEMAGQDRTVVLYESPHRLKTLLEEIESEMSGVEVVLAREMTKIHEEVWGGPVAELRRMLEGRSLKGEITLVLRPTPDPQREED